MAMRNIPTLSERTKLLTSEEKEIEKTLEMLEWCRDELERLQPESLLQEVQQRSQTRNIYIVKAMKLGISEREISRRAGVTRSWIWKLKKATAR